MNLKMKMKTVDLILILKMIADEKHNMTNKNSIFADND